MIENNRIILVDNEEDELNQLKKIFDKYGIGCRSFLYDGFNFPSQPLCGVRFAFFDMKLSQASEMNASLKEAISRFISVKNGPFILIFWTKHQEAISSFKDFVNREEDEFKQKIRPILLKNIDKTEFLTAELRLEEKLEQILSSDLANCIIKFEDSVVDTAAKTLDSIFSVLNVEEDWGENEKFDKACRLVFSKIAESTLGLTRAKKDPDLAIKESLTIIFKHLLFQHQDAYWKDYLTPLKLAETSSGISFPPGFSSEKLNSVFHIDTNRLDHKSFSDRGAVSILNTSFFEDLFGIDPSTWLESSLQISQNKVVDNSNENPIETRGVLLVVVELSAACDFSQNKPRTNKYLLGALLSDPFREKIKKKKKSLKEQIYILPFDFQYNGKDYSLVFDLNYAFNLPKSISALADPLFVLSKETMDLISLKYSSHISRLGITFFRKK